MICDECKECNNFHVSEQGCFGSDKPCEYLHPNADDFWLEEYAKMCRELGEVDNEEKDNI